MAGQMGLGVVTVAAQRSDFTRNGLRRNGLRRDGRVGDGDGADDGGDKEQHRADLQQPSEAGAGQRAGGNQPYAGRRDPSRKGRSGFRLYRPPPPPPMIIFTLLVFIMTDNLSLNLSRQQSI